MTSHEQLMKLATRVVVLQEEERRRRWIAALESAFETVPGDVRFCVRRAEVVNHLAGAFGVPVINNQFFGDVARFARRLGWQPVKNGGRSLFRCVKRKDQTLEEALAASRAHRHDPRSRQRTPGPNLPTLPAT